jgi:predicted membrane-bound dolichyl-phosphate-mannose-protein mannosyltransferase
MGCDPAHKSRDNIDAPFMWSIFSIVQGHAVVQLVEALPYKVAGSIPDGVIGIFH